jgi:hypothetical protein
MFIKIENNSPIGYPILENNLRAILTDRSLPLEIKTSDIIDKGFAVYKSISKPETGDFEVAEEDSFSFDGTIVTQKWKVRPMTSEEKTEFTEFKKMEVLSNVQLELVQSDWTELPSNQQRKTEEWKIEWAEYRQKLREVKDQSGFPFQVDWPKKPEINTRTGNN